MDWKERKDIRTFLEDVFLFWTVSVGINGKKYHTLWKLSLVLLLSVVWQTKVFRTLGMTAATSIK